MFAVGVDILVAEWLVLGPFPNPEPIAPVPGGDYREGFYRDWLAPLGGEANARIAPGTTVAYTGPDGTDRTVSATNATIDENGVVDLAARFPGAEPATVYLACGIRAERAETIHGYLATTGSARVWIGGAEVHSRCFPEGEPPRPERQIFTARVNPGENPVLMKVERAKPWWYVGLDFADDRQRRADERVRRFELAAFQGVEIVPAGGRWLFEPGTLPAVEWTDPALVETTMGPIPLAARWYRVVWSADGESAEFDEVSVAGAPGTYLGVAEGRTSDGTRVVRGLTAACVPAGWTPPADGIERYIDALPLLSGREIMLPGFRTPHVRETVRDIAATIVPPIAGPGTPDHAILLAAVERAGRLRRPLRRIDDPYVVNNDIHAMLRFLRDGRGAPLRLAQPRRIDPPAPVLRPGTPEEAGMAPYIVAKLDDLCARWAGAEGEPHANLVARRGVVLYDRAFGETTPDTPMWVASITKMLSALLFARYVDQGLMDWDDPVGTFLPDFATEGPDVLRIRNLLDHTSGLSGHGWWGGIYNTYLDSVIANGAAYLHPGARHNYGGMGYDLAGRIVEAISGRGVLRIVYDDLLDELGLADTTMGDFGGYTFASARDLGVVAQMMCNGGSYGRKEYFRPEILERMKPTRLSDRYPAIPPDIEWGMRLLWMRHLRPDRGKDGVPDDAVFFSRNTFGHGAASSATFLVDPDHRLVVIQTRKTGSGVFWDYAVPFFAVIDEGIAPSD